MYYKVFLVEDEIATREGIRDHIDWHAAGFEFCGEAPDGEIALPLIEDIQPDVLVTDIKMPFMDGLQLTRIVREHLPWVKVVILSGYDEFSYAQAAVKLGVTEYLLKPVFVPDLNNVLRKIKTSLDQEKSDREYLKVLRSQVEDNLVLLREKFLLRLILGGESSISAIEQSEQLGLKILAKCYLVLIVKIHPITDATPSDFATCQEVEKLIAGLVGANIDPLLTRKDTEELVLILKGENVGELEEKAQLLSDLIHKEIEGKTACSLTIAAGSPQPRLGDLHRSYAEALVKVQDARQDFENGELRKLDQDALMCFLESGSETDFEAFFEAYIRPLGEVALRSKFLKHYIMIDIILTVAQFISDLGGNVDHMVPEVHHGDILLAKIRSLEQIKSETKRLISTAHLFRDAQVNNNRAVVIHQSKAYIQNHFTDPGLSLNEVAAQASFSPNHFSAVFSDESGETFRDYLARTRVAQARKLLRTTNQMISEIALQCGYKDPHYFSIIFRKHTGLTPQQFREAPKK